MIDCEKPGDCAYPGCDCEDDSDPFDECCPVCGYDCAGANPPIAACPMKNRPIDTRDELHQVLGEALAKYSSPAQE
jgi:hypothetical protein